VTQHLVGIDIGTTATKGIILHPERGICAEAQAPATLRTPQPGWAEEDPAQWWDNVGRVIRACLAESDIQPHQIGAVGVSGMVPTLIALDGRGNLLYPSIQQNDARAFVEIEHLRSRTVEAQVLAQTGSAITQQSIGPKLLWLQRHLSHVFRQIAHVMGSYDYIVYRLTGRLSVERNWALESGLFDLHTEDWSVDLLELNGLSRDWLGPVHWPSDVVGEVTPEAAAEAGLTAGTPVVAGSADHIASAFSAGLKSPGDLLVKLGGAGDILYSLDQPLVDARLFLDYHVIPGKFLLNGCMAASGSIIRWFRQEFALQADYAALDQMADAIPPGSDKLVLLPYFLGEKTPINDPLARGVLFGLTLSHSRAHVYRAILEGIAYGFHHHLDVLRERGLEATQARVTNGGARSTLWKKVTADVLGLPLEQVVQHPGSSLGAAFVAGMGVGVFDSWAEIERFIEIAAVIEPDAVAHERYQQLYAVYRNLYSSLKSQFALLSQI
jgi:xylulokinase